MLKRLLADAELEKVALKVSRRKFLSPERRRAAVYSPGEGPEGE